MVSEAYRYTDQLTSDRLITRFVTEDDSKIWTEFFRNKETIEYFPFSYESPEKRAQAWIDRQLKRYAENKYGLQAIIDKRTNLFVGQCGLLLQEVDGKKELEVGYHILREFWGKGYAPETAKLFIDWAFENKLTNSVISIIDTRNLRSQRVAEKNGLIREKKTSWMGMEVYIYRIHKP